MKRLIILIMVLVEMSEPIQACSCKCCECDKQAVAFWPMVDPDIPHYPYCRECLDKVKTSLLIKMEEQGLFK